MLFSRATLAPVGADGRSLAGRKVWVPAMSYGSARAFVAALRSVGLEAEITPPSNARTRELGSQHSSGDECYPLQVTLGDFLRILEQPGTDPKRTAFFMATAGGPCRFGQYVPFMEKKLAQLGYGDVKVLSPNDNGGYGDVSELGTGFERTGWRALVAGDILLKRLLQTRPYECRPGSADRVFGQSVDDVCETLEIQYPDQKAQMAALQGSLKRARERFHRLALRPDRDRPLVGIVGEIFCRLNTFSNDDLVRRLEEQGAEAWMSDIAEWLWYTNSEQFRRFRLEGRTVSLEHLGARLRTRAQKKDEHQLVSLFEEDFRGQEEPEDFELLLKYAEPYLPASGAMGEMVVNTGRAIYLARKGVDGILDISPFTCMNGIVCEAIYPRISADHGNIPIRNFYFDGTQTDLDSRLGIYVEMARSYRVRKQILP
jgi:predicted nucleotide-binding protein (sugar kinase/HSP70/actin superfamily)